MKRSGPRKEPSADVKWEEVWTWCEEIRAKWGYWATVSIHPPLPSQKRVRFIVVVRLEIFDTQRGNYTTKITDSTSVMGLTATAESVALGIVSQMYMNLDTRAIEAERAALEAGALL